MIELAEGKVFGGRYRLERELARGGMGAVWIAHHLQLDCGVAIKFMDPEFAASKSARMRFEREAKAAAQLRTPHVVQVYDHGVDADTPYIVMELLEGEDLGARLKRQRRLTLPAVSAILDQLAKGLQRAHDLGIVHRDLKPGNVFLAKSEDGDLVKILDFGIAKSGVAITDESTKTGEILGSPHYMSPEQAKGSRSVDHRSDLWSLGVILFRAVTGQRPFAGETFGELVISICVDPAPAASKVAPDLGPAVDRFFERALARDPEQRFQRARDMASVFAAIAEDATGRTWPEPGPASIPEVSTGDLLLRARRPALEIPLASASPSGLPRDGLEGTLTTANGTFGARNSWSSRRPAALLAAGALGVLVALGGALALLRGPAISPHAGGAFEEGSSLPAGSQASPLTQAPPAMSSAPSAPAASASAPASPSKTTRPRVVAPSSPPAPPTSRARAPNCNPPFTVDADGVKHAKLECL